MTNHKLRRTEDGTMGDQDIFVSNEMVEAMAQRLRHPIIHRLPGKGHLCIEHWKDAFQHVS